MKSYDHLCAELRAKKAELALVRMQAERDLLQRRLKDSEECRNNLFDGMVASGQRANRAEAQRDRAVAGWHKLNAKVLELVAGHDSQWK